MFTLLQLPVWAPVSGLVCMVSRDNPEEFSSILVTNDVFQVCGVIRVSVSQLSFHYHVSLLGNC